MRMIAVFTLVLPVVLPYDYQRRNVPPFLAWEFTDEPRAGARCLCPSFLQESHQRLEL